MNEPNTPESGSEGDDSSELTGSGLAAEKTRRLTRVDQLRDAGVNPYPYRFDRSHTLTEVRAQWGSLEPGTETENAVAIAGRLMLKREQGKLIFATVRDRSDDIQLFVSKAVVGDDAFADIGALDLAGANPEGKRTHRAMCGGMAVAAHHRRAGQSEALLRPHRC